MSDPADLRKAKRIMILSRSNGVSGLTLGLVAVGCSLYGGDLLALLASLGLCGGGALEFLGSVRAARRDASTPRFLVASQVVSLVSVLCLAIRCTMLLSPAAALGLLPESYKEGLLILYPSPGEAEAFLRTGIRMVMGALVAVAAIFEMGMAAYYASSTGLFLRISAATNRK